MNEELTQEWTEWPLTCGQQFIYLDGEIWVGNINRYLNHPEKGISFSVWRGSSVYSITEKYGTKMKFKQINWPESPKK